jgi:acyl-CoA reductase-like NAD-dependent aldehyde dehydrogenase
VLKPAIPALHSSNLIASIVADTFDPALVSVVPGGAETAQSLLEEHFDYIFFTGGPATGKLVMQAAARHLTPVTLELGGKNPCIVDADVRLDYTARRIVWGKFFNAGQNCVAVDYLLVDRRIKQQLLDRMADLVAEFYGPNPSRSPDYARIINDHHFDRLAGLMTKGMIVIGGRTDRSSRYIPPTILDQVGENDPIMADEIFGPLLPVLAFDNLSDAIAMVNARPNPLALYFFSRSAEKQERVLRETASGGVCINDTLIHQTWQLPFGGIGNSGMGKYHGKAGFDTFAHYRGIMKSSFLFDLLLRYPPYKDGVKWLKRLFTV